MRTTFVPLSYLPFASLCEMELGRCYSLMTQWHKVYKGILIRTGIKGFNLVDPDTSRCIFNRAVYRKNSGKSEIPDNQAIFKICLPKWIITVAKTDEFLATKNIPNSQEKAI